MSTVPTPPELPPATATARAARSARWKLFAILAVCAAPVLASYLAYFVIRPVGRTNYGALIEPQRALSVVRLRAAPDGALAFADLRGRWVLVALDAGDCPPACVERLWTMRQVRLTTGRDRDRIERVLLVTGERAPADALLRDYEGMRVAFIPPAELARLFPAEPATTPLDHLYVVDPRGHLMMRYPAAADPNRIKKDVSRLLRAAGAN